MYKLFFRHFMHNPDITKDLWQILQDKIKQFSTLNFCCFVDFSRILSIVIEKNAKNIYNQVIALLQIQNRKQKGNPK